MVKFLQKLDIWIISQEIIKKVYKYTNSLPESEKFSMQLQMRRAVLSVSNNIAEAHGCYYYKDKIRFWYIALGSLEELRSQLCTCKNLGYGSIGDIDKMLRILNNISVKLNNTISNTKKQNYN